MLTIPVWFVTVTVEYCGVIEKSSIFKRSVPEAVAVPLVPVIVAM